MPVNLTNPPDVLSYLIPAAEKEHFVRFVKEGEKNADGSFKKAQNGSKMTGVVAWLKANGHTEARFFSLPQPDDKLLFIVTANKDALADWHKIPGFEETF